MITCNDIPSDRFIQTLADRLGVSYDAIASAISAAMYDNGVNKLEIKCSAVSIEVSSKYTTGYSFQKN